MCSLHSLFLPPYREIKYSCAPLPPVDSKELILTYAWGNYTSNLKVSQATTVLTSHSNTCRVLRWLPGWGLRSELSHLTLSPAAAFLTAPAKTGESLLRVCHQVSRFQRVGAIPPQGNLQSSSPQPVGHNPFTGAT